MNGIFTHPYVTLALALAAGAFAQVIATHMRLPSIVVLLVAGVLLGPDVLGWLAPSALGEGLQGLVSFAVAVILFEGGLHLDISRLRREQKAIRRLVTVGALVTAVTATVAVKLCMNWPWNISALFGALVIVSGPTVIKPLLRRIQVKSTVATILEAEGVLIDAVGAITAVVVLEVVLRPTGLQAMNGFANMVGRLTFGAAVGFASGWLMVVLRGAPRFIHDGMENIVTLALVLLIFQLSNVLVHETGIATVTVAGMVVGHASKRAKDNLIEFKEQLTVLFIGALFVLLAADVRLSEVYSLGWGAVFTVLCMLFIVRPLCVWSSTSGAPLGWRQRLFLAWIGPRGIVAAAIATLFAEELEHAGLPGGGELKALVFVVIAASVLTAGLTGGIVARLLGLRRKSDNGWAIVGASELALTLGGLLQCKGEEIACIESNPKACREAESRGFHCVYGNALKPEALRLAEVETRRGLLACTPNEQTNYLVAHRARNVARGRFMAIVVEDWEAGVTSDMVKDAGIKCLFASAVDVDLWSTRIRHKQTQLQWWRAPKKIKDPWPFDLKNTSALAIPLVRRLAKDRCWPLVHSDLRATSEIAWLMEKDKTTEISSFLRKKGWTLCEEPESSQPAKD